MKPFEGICLLLLFASLFLANCSGSDGAPSPHHSLQRDDHACQVNIGESGSLQNPAWSPDGNSIVFTRFRNGYNGGPADLMIMNLQSEVVRTVVSDGSDNANLPGSACNPITHQIVFSSSREPHDEILVGHENPWEGREKAEWTFNLTVIVK